MRKITEEEIKEIIDRYNSGETKDQISKALKIDIRRLRKILKENGIENKKRIFRT